MASHLYNLLAQTGFLVVDALKVHDMLINRLFKIDGQVFQNINQDAAMNKLKLKLPHDNKHRSHRSVCLVIIPQYTVTIQCNIITTGNMEIVWPSNQFKIQRFNEAVDA